MLLLTLFNTSAPQRIRRAAVVHALTASGAQLVALNLHCVKTLMTIQAVLDCDLEPAKLLRKICSCARIAPARRLKARRSPCSHACFAVGNCMLCKTLKCMWGHVNSTAARFVAKVAVKLYKMQMLRSIACFLDAPHNLLSDQSSRFSTC